MIHLRRRLPVLGLALAAVIGLTGAVGPSAPPRAVATATTAQQDNFTPGPYHSRLEPLVGTWQAVKYNWLLGDGDEPATSRDFTVDVRWIEGTGGRFLSEETRGTLAGMDYYRHGVLGFSNVDRRYEWTTFDSVTPTTMTYRGDPVDAEGTARRGHGARTVISIPGEFTDPGVLGPECAGKTIPMRTEITIRPNDRHVIDLYFTPPGQEERLVDRVVYLRRTDA
ncbi:DUF1579 family protein [Streptomyces sp. JJ38]|uniref:DUF1579 family protein n=1 Tax=Streptomyces sp. JJ38 TaxID=2738128 RepID=UPI001C56E12D|nr:DUF1579 family protein [Streptomyces sp. JJ38]MBW1598991.1 DUF1579 family protein [Streptomyces sp. JJ38]